ncbi:predicted protein [Plenodomus lingam JN3]|uniref:Predicted protein n=1 Tax=Leptosphaeria maculans (strain JN3 / isolate v23.1.3 / race Av1-4-5-6-7-8) TaxID=985895 RepID=E5AC72_LEPMJ|nr:predicted protein [Plenodomus lingam JN3]CBY02074.1 predicted protein [Plenodomus lingam JN3]
MTPVTRAVSTKTCFSTRNAFEAVNLAHGPHSARALPVRYGSLAATEGR